MKKLPLKEERLIGWFYDKLDEGKFEFIDDKAGLIDLIANFSEEKKRTDKVEYGIRIWEHLFMEALNALGGSTRGVDRLAEKLRVFAEFEELLYGADPWYREHTLHPLYVFVLGEYLMDKSDLDFKDLSGPHGAINEEIEASWCIISLAHDLGIPLDRITKIGGSMLKTLKKYGEYSVQLFSFDFPYPTLKIVENLIEILSLKYEKMVKKGDKIMFKPYDIPDVLRHEEPQGMVQLGFFHYMRHTALPPPESSYVPSWKGSHHRVP